MGKRWPKKRFQEQRTRLGSEEALNRQLKLVGLTKEEALAKWTEAATAEIVLKRELKVNTMEGLTQQALQNQFPDYIAKSKKEAGVEILDEALRSIKTSSNQQVTGPAKRGTASYTINIEVAFNSEITQGQNRVMVELQQGVPGSSTVFDTKYFEGQMATVSFSQMPAGSYFLAIGNGDSVAVGPVHQFSYGQRQHSTVRVTQSSGNIGTRSRSGL